MQDFELEIICHLADTFLSKATHNTLTEAIPPE